MCTGILSFSLCCNFVSLCFGERPRLNNRDGKKLLFPVEIYLERNENWKIKFFTLSSLLVTKN